MDTNQYTTNSIERKPGKHLTSEDRGAIQAMKKLGCSNREIARQLHCSPSTVANELKRGTPPKTGSRGRTPGYSPKLGALVYHAHRLNSHKSHRITQCASFVDWLMDKVRKEKWSLDACVGYARKHQLFPASEMVCTKTLYNEVWQDNLPLKVLDLPEAIKRKRSHKSTNEWKKAHGTSIDERPEIVNTRIEAGHWEGDTVVGKRNGKEAVIFTLLEKQTQHYIAIKIPGKTSEAVNSAMEGLRQQYGEKFSQVFKTITVDNGAEFTEFADVERYGTKVYYAHPYTSWERPQNERHNGLLRRYVPKGESIEHFTEEEILWAADALNALPRKKLGYCTPEERFEAFLDSVYAA